MLRLYYKVATFEPELREHVSFTTAVLQSCDFQARAPGARFLYYGCTTKLRLSSQSSGSTFPLRTCPPKPALQNQGTPNNKKCFAGRVFFLLGRGGGGASFIIRGKGLNVQHHAIVEVTSQANKEHSERSSRARGSTGHLRMTKVIDPASFPERPALGEVGGVALRVSCAPLGCCAPSQPASISSTSESTACSKCWAVRAVRCSESHAKRSASGPRSSSSLMRTSRSQRSRARFARSAWTCHRCELGCLQRSMQITSRMSGNEWCLS